MAIKIALLAIGENPIQLIDYLLKYQGLQLSIVTMNLLDYELPPLNENAAPQVHRHELRHILRQLGIFENISISSSLMDLIKSNDRLDLGETDLTISSHIDQIENIKSQRLFDFMSLSEAFRFILQESMKLLTSEYQPRTFFNSTRKKDKFSIKLPCDSIS